MYSTVRYDRKSTIRDKVLGDIFFFDPPFADFNFIQNLEMIKKKKFFKKNHVLVIHRERGTIDKLEDLIITLETKQYGRSKIIFGIFN